MNPFTRLFHLFSQVLFSTITPLLLIPRIGRLRVTRRAVSFFFGKLYGNRYERIIDSFEGRYELAMTEGLTSAKKMTGGRASVILDCGTGTGFVTRQAAKEFPAATFIGLDILPGMLRQARDNCKHLTNEVLHVRADAFALPLADQSVDLVLAQNTMPCIAEFARVCRPGGVTVYVDSSAGWIAGLVKQLVEKYGLFEQVIGKRPLLSDPRWISDDARNGRMRDLRTASKGLRSLMKAARHTQCAPAHSGGVARLARPLSRPPDHGRLRTRAGPSSAGRSGASR